MGPPDATGRPGEQGGHRAVSVGRLGRVDAAAEDFSRYIATLSVICMLVLSILTAVDVGLRAWARSPIAGFNEIVEQLLAIAIAGCFPGSIAQRRHLTLDMLSRFVGPRLAGWFRAFGALALLGGFFLLAWRIGIQSVAIAERGETTTIMEMPRGPVMYTITALLVLSVAIQGIVFLASLQDAARTSAAGARAADGAPRPVWRSLVGFAAWVAVVGIVFVVLFDRFEAPLREELGLLFAIGFVFMWTLGAALVPLGVAMMLAGLAGLAVILEPQQAVLAYGSMLTDFLVRIDLAVLPLFVLMGSLAAAAGLSDDLYRFAQALLGRQRGGLALATIAGCAGFGAVTGSSIATVATIGRVALPEMRKRGYSIELAAGSVAAGGTLGILVPPSGAMILYAFLTEVSIGKLFIAALLPACLAITLYMITIAITVRLDPNSAPGSQAWDWREIVDSAKGSFAVVILFGAVLGGIYGGIFTGTEAAAVGAGGAFVIAVARGRINRQTFLQVMAETTSTTGMLYILIFGGITFSAFISLTETTENVVAFIQSMQIAPVAVIALLLGVYIFLGSVMEAYAIMLITVPITAPLMEALGYDLVWWGIMQVVVIETGLMTPPVGMNVFAIKSIAEDVPLRRVFKGVMPFVGADVIRLAILTLFPAIVTWLPSTMR
jgi:tripartite ATP-independent transporter DctM subunit